MGVDVTSFTEAIRRALRQDPDVILVGEMRDLETIEAAITAAETGHIVFGTLHTSSAAGTINRIIDVFPTNQQEQIRTQLASAIIGILCQQLLKKVGGGRVAAFETLVVTPGIANLIRENKIFRITSSIQTGARHGMMLLDDYIFNLWKDGLDHEGRRPREVQQRRRTGQSVCAGRARRLRRSTQRRRRERGVANGSIHSQPLISDL